MLKSARTPAEEHFAATQRKLRQVQKDKDKAKQEVSAQVAKLREQRLAKEAGERQGAEAVIAKPAKKKKPVMPKAHRPHL